MKEYDSEINIGSSGGKSIGQSDYKHFLRIKVLSKSRNTRRKLPKELQSYIFSFCPFSLTTLVWFAAQLQSVCRASYRPSQSLLILPFLYPVCVCGRQSLFFCKESVLTEYLSFYRLGSLGKVENLVVFIPSISARASLVLVATDLPKEKEIMEQSSGLQAESVEAADSVRQAMILTHLQQEPDEVQYAMRNTCSGILFGIYSWLRTFFIKISLSCTSFSNSGYACNIKVKTISNATGRIHIPPTAPNSSSCAALDLTYSVLTTMTLKVSPNDLDK
ncbi:hypothetical protein BDP27DRAFT_737451 [Rhodocollybia butyracea]|uniref:Uncharacterized protein n=1 Tax=Rhodocollybia butyracea TaxID=206335 RepID=A0A9P5PVE9_9AGAR|nr:hypothetical protein BDP27DRAFT_737451 [Rhodocollybia butyracea]